ncbi:NAD-dependent epimerase/dehydratase family protein [Achromobacter sp. Bel]|uniref:NAD-dependent epimerase/dehydratase family protein n=1 Tax=Achromobacter sp. Bel TaxID=2727415 RepID=UPI00145D6677|nr:NAD-dependent epimerase/dehydratase family protein [Achromobacter sp. Bel]NMK49328.1 NAD-dependent epimerase/dehydratase family protein [Achromobacter sp. Bel]
MSHTDRVTVGVLGATSPVGRQVLAQLAGAGHSVVAFSRRPQQSDDARVRWATLPGTVEDGGQPIPHWIALCGIWNLPEHFDLMLRHGVRRVVCLSSTSRFTKTTSSNPQEEEIVRRLVEGERQIAEWAQAHGVEWTILRPTLIYGRGTDRNLAEIVKLIRKLGRFPLFGRSEGLRQPVYVDDVAKAAVLSVFSADAGCKSYNISGAEVLTYREMVSRIFKAMGREPRFLSVPIWLFNVALFFLRLIPRYRKWNADMVQRMNRDMVFDHDDARRDFAYDPQRFVLREIDVSA